MHILIGFRIHSGGQMCSAEPVSGAHLGWLTPHSLVLICNIMIGVSHEGCVTA